MPVGGGLELQPRGVAKVFVDIASPAATQITARVECDFDFLSAEYRTLFERSGATAFQSPIWLHCLYSVLVTGLGAKPHIVTGRDEGGHLRMLIPLVSQRSATVCLLQPADLGVSDYNCIVADTATHDVLSNDQAFLLQVKACLAPADVLIFRKIPRCPEAVAAILGAGELMLNDNAGYELGLGNGTFEEWQKTTLKKKFRNGIRRKRRGLQETQKSVEWISFTDPADIERAILFIRDLRSVKFKDDILHLQPYVDFYTGVAMMGAASGEAVTSGMLVDGELISADFGMVNQDAHHAILCASKLDEYGQYSPGLQSLFGTIQRSHENGKVRFDFGIGKTRQKSDFGSTEIPLYNLTLARSAKGRAVSLVYNRAKPVKTLLRRFAKRIR